MGFEHGRVIINNRPEFKAVTDEIIKMENHQNIAVWGRQVGKTGLKQAMLDQYTEETGRCAHETCTECRGSGIKKSGQKCVHMLVCRCKKCKPSH